MPARAESANNDSTVTIGFEATASRSPQGNRWFAAGSLCNNMDAAEPSGAGQTSRQGSPKFGRGGAN